MATVNHHKILTLPTKPIWAYDLIIAISDDSGPKGRDAASLQQRARILLKKEVLSVLGEHYAFDGVSQIWTPGPEPLFPEGETRYLKVAMEPRRDGSKNNMDITLRNKGPLDVKRLALDVMAGVIGLNPAGNPKLENQIKWLQACFRKDPASRLVTRPNSNAYFDRSKETTMALRSTAGVLEARRGTFQTVQFRFDMLTMNVDTATTPFWVPNMCLLDACAALMGVKRPDLKGVFNNPALFRTKCSKLIGIYFKVRHLGDKGNEVKLKMHSFTNANAFDTRFDERRPDGSTVQTNVNTYFLTKYNIKLGWPELPLINTTKGDFPVEVCFSSDRERYKEILQGSETADFIK